MRVVVVGATGNVGAAPLEALAANGRGEDIVALARRPPEAHARKTRFVAADIARDDLTRWAPWSTPPQWGCVLAGRGPVRRRVVADAQPRRSSVSAVPPVSISGCSPALPATGPVAPWPAAPSVAGRLALPGRAHTKDVAEAYRRLVVVGTARGAFNIAAEPVIDAAVLGRLLGARTVPVREAARGVLAALWCLHAVSRRAGGRSVVVTPPEETR